MFVYLLLSYDTCTITVKVVSPELGVENGDYITHDGAVSFLREKSPHGFTRLLLLVLYNVNRILRVTNHNKNMHNNTKCVCAGTCRLSRDITLSALDCSSSVMFLILAIPSICIMSG